MQHISSDQCGKLLLVSSTAACGGKETSLSADLTQNGNKHNVRLNNKVKLNGNSVRLSG